MSFICRGMESEGGCDSPRRMTVTPPRTASSVAISWLWARAGEPRPGVPTTPMAAATSGWLQPIRPNLVIFHFFPVYDEPPSNLSKGVGFVRPLGPSYGAGEINESRKVRG